MMKFDCYKVTFQEIPNEISLTFSITGCIKNCEGCHSPQLREDIGEELTEELLKELIEKNKKFITCVLFLGGDNKKEELKNLIKIVKSFNLKVALYTGEDFVDEYWKDVLDYIKIGHYDKDKGPITKITTNQQLIDLKNNKNITNLMWKNL